ncbi:B12-binding domain-containing radical SAM protein [Candidatus Falkowbacteria bacterium]|nr:B12-binding domain-containing radical SAM protein [Candidatus Falkowbacteria bacterium]
MISLVKINYTQDHSQHILPLGILSVGSALKRAGFKVKLSNINEKQISALVHELALMKPLYVGLSVMTGIQTKHAVEFSKFLKEKAPEIKIVWGGIHPSLLSEQCLREDYVDYVMIGEGEVTSVEFAQALSGGDDLSKVKGLGFKLDGELVFNEERPFINDLDEYPIDWGLVDLEKYIYPLAGYKRVIAYKSSRGCPFDCGFCYNRIFNKNTWRTWSVEQVVRDINFLKKEYKVEAIKFYDDNFFVNKDRALEILEGIKMPAHFEVRIDAVTEELARKLKEYQAFDLLIGVESGSDRILKMLNKRITVDDIKKAAKILGKYDLRATYSTIVGVPTETKEEFEKTIDLMYELYKIHPKAVFTLGAYMPYPGSKLYDFCLEHGFRPPKTTEGWGNIDRFRPDFKNPWADGKRVWIIREYFKLLKFRLGPVNRWFEWRIKHRFFALPLDIYVIEYLSGLGIEGKGPLGKLIRKVYKKS